MRLFRLSLPFAVLALTGCEFLNGESDPSNGVTDISVTPPAATSSALVYYDTCEDLLTDMRASMADEMTARLLNAENHYYGGVDAVAEDGNTDDAEGAPTAEAGDAGGTGAANDSRTEGEDFSGTNNQEEGVDEADFVKTDGYHIYVLNGNRLEIFGRSRIWRIKSRVDDGHRRAPNADAARRQPIGGFFDGECLRRRGGRRIASVGDGRCDDGRPRRVLLLSILPADKGNRC